MLSVKYAKKIDLYSRLENRFYLEIGMNQLQEDVVDIRKVRFRSGGGNIGETILDRITFDKKLLPEFILALKKLEKEVMENEIDM